MATLRFVIDARTGRGSCTAKHPNGVQEIQSADVDEPQKSHLAPRWITKSVLS